MPILGAHMSIAGGLHLAFERIRKVGGEALQIFTKNERQWRAPQIDQRQAELFILYWERYNYIPVAAHDSYLINLAAPDPLILKKSIDAFADELRRTELLRIPYLIMHPGSHLGQGVEKGLATFVANLDRALETSETHEVMVLIETTAGQGTNLGSNFEEIAFILRESKNRERLGVCFDTCHCFAAGYDLRDTGSYRRTFSDFDSVVGLQHLRFFHLNDSKRELGSRVDRHEHIGRGKIGLEGFKLLLCDDRFKEHPMVLETPKGKDLKEDKENLKTLRMLIAEKRVSEKTEDI